MGRNPSNRLPSETANETGRPHFPIAQQLALSTTDQSIYTNRISRGLGGRQHSTSTPMAPPPAGSTSSSSSREGYRSVNASHRYLKHAGPSRDEPEPQQKRSKYHVTRHRRRPTIMAHTDNSDLDPAWQDLDRYVPTHLTSLPVSPVESRLPDGAGCQGPSLHSSAPNLGEFHSFTHSTS
jgi:hypothetical protein